MQIIPTDAARDIWEIYCRWCTWQRIIYLLIIGNLNCFFLVQTFAEDAVIRGELGLTWQPWIWALSMVFGYTLIAPINIYCCDQWPLNKSQFLKTFIKFALMYFPVSLLYITVMLFLRHSGYFLMAGELFETGGLIDFYLYEFPRVIIAYAIFVFITYTKIYYDSTQKEQLNAAELENELQAVRMQTLRSQLQPNFLFNTLNLMSSSVHHDADKTDSIIMCLGDLLRYSLATEQKPFVTLKQEIQAMNSFLEIAKLRFDKRLTFKFDIATDTELVMLPNLLLLPLLESAIENAIEPSEKAEELSLTTSLKDTHLNIVITFPYLSVDLQQGNFKRSLKTTKEKLNLLYEKLAEVTVETIVNQQTSLNLTLPV